MKGHSLIEALFEVSICTQQPSPGYGECGRQATMKFYFDSVNLRCQPFSYIECNGGNANRFNTLEECERFCSSTGFLLFL